MIRFEPTTDAHLDAILPRRCDDHTTAKGRWDLTYSVTMLEDGCPIAAAGITRIYDKTGEAWSFFSERAIARYPLALTRAAKRYLDEWEEKGDFHRLTAVTRAEHAYVHWLEILGFEIEGYMVRFGPGAEGDFVVMGRVR